MAEHTADSVAEFLARLAHARPGADVVDIGGGSGTRAVPLAQAGCSVVVVDSSTDALASLARRANEAGVADRIRSLQADADRVASVLEPSSADLVLHHHVVQEVDDPLRSLQEAATVLRPGGSLSIIAPGRLSAVLVEALAGHYAAASDVLNGTADADRYYDVPGLRALIERAGLVVESVVGVGVATALAGDRSLAATDPLAAALESDLGRHPVLGQIAADLHVVALRPVE